MTEGSSLVHVDDVHVLHDEGDRIKLHLLLAKAKMQGG